MPKELLLLLTFPAPVLSIVVANYSEPTNLRFNDHPAFIGHPYDWSGVGRVSATLDTGPISDFREWATLIGDNVFLSATHFRPSTGDTITFASGNSPGSPTFNYEVAGGFAVPGTDIWIGYTAEAADASLKRYNVNTIAADNLTDTGLAGNSLFLNGDDVTGGGGTLADTVVGTNQASLFLNTGDTSINTPGVTIPLESPINFDLIITFQNLVGDTTHPASPYEAQVQGGDSGAPLFNISGGELEIVGAAFSVFSQPIQGNFIDTQGPAGSANDPLEAREGSLYSYFGSYETEINSAIAMVPAPVPEPSSLMLLLLSTITLFRRSK